MKGYYSIFNPKGEKIADCGIERDAITLIYMRNKYWDGHYYQFYPLPGDIIDVKNNQLSPNQKYIESKDIIKKQFDIEYIKVGGQEIPLQQKQLPKNNLKKINF